MEGARQPFNLPRAPPNANLAGSNRPPSTAIVAWKPGPGRTNSTATMLVSFLALGAVVVMASCLVVVIRRSRQTRVVLQAILEHSPTGIVIKDPGGRYL